MVELKYFKYKEFDSPDKPGSGDQMDCDFLKMIDRARHLSKCSYSINSGYRTPKHNKKVGGSKTSSHLGGFGGDIRCLTSERRIQILRGLIIAGFKRIGIAKTFIHADNDPSKPDSVWLY